MSTAVGVILAASNLISGVFMLSHGDTILAAVNLVTAGALITSTLLCGR